MRCRGAEFERKMQVRWLSVDGEGPIRRQVESDLICFLSPRGADVYEAIESLFR